MSARLGIAAHFQKPVESPCLPAGRFFHPLGGAPCRSGKFNAHTLSLKHGDHGIDSGRLSRAGAAGEDHQRVLHRLQDSLHLHLIQFISRSCSRRYCP